MFSLSLSVCLSVCLSVSVSMCHTNARSWQGPRTCEEKSENLTLEFIQLDDGGPKSVEEQSLLLLVWKHYIRRQYIKDV